MARGEQIGNGRLTRTIPLGHCGSPDTVRYLIHIYFVTGQQDTTAQVSLYWKVVTTTVTDSYSNKYFPRRVVVVEPGAPVDQNKDDYYSYYYLDQKKQDFYNQ